MYVCTYAYVCTYVCITSGLLRLPLVTFLDLVRDEETKRF